MWRAVPLLEHIKERLSGIWTETFPRLEQTGEGHCPDSTQILGSQATPSGCSALSVAILAQQHNLQSVAHWERLRAFVKSSAAAWGVKRWCTSFQLTKRGKLHARLKVQFTQIVDRARFDLPDETNIGQLQVLP